MDAGGGRFFSERPAYALRSKGRRVHQGVYSASCDSSMSSLGEPSVLEEVDISQPMSRSEAKKLLSGSEPRWVFSNAQRTELFELARQHNLSAQTLIFDTTIPEGMHCKANASLSQHWEKNGKVTTSHNKTVTAHRLLVGNRAFIVYPDYFHSTPGIRDPESVTTCEMFTHKGNNPHKDDQYNHIAVISPHTGALLEDSEPELLLYCSNPHSSGKGPLRYKRS